jgi:hypothetical protein
MPLLLFGFQEPIERLAVHHALPASVFSEPTFLVGVALQVPAGVVVWALARLLLEAAAVVRRLLVESPVRRPAYRHARAARPVRIFLPMRSPLACSLAKRGPPRLLLL